MTAPVLLFDGVCVLCQGSVRWLLRHERGAELRFGALQSEAARRLLEERGHPVPALGGETVLLVDGAGVHERSTAVLRVLRYVRWPWRAAAVLRIVPRPLRDWAYDFVARRRYRWFGSTETCLVPDPALRERFLDGGA